MKTFEQLQNTAKKIYIEILEETDCAQERAAILGIIAHCINEYHTFHRVLSIGHYYFQNRLDAERPQTKIEHIAEIKTTLIKDCIK